MMHNVRNTLVLMIKLAWKVILLENIPMADVLGVTNITCTSDGAYITRPPRQDQPVFSHIVKYKLETILVRHILSTVFHCY